MFSQGPLIRCIRCDTVDHPDTAEAQVALVNHTRLSVAQVTKEVPELITYHPLVCTMCLTGHWHNQFPKATYDSAKDRVLNPPQGGPGTTVFSL